MKFITRFKMSFLCAGLVFLIFICGGKAQSQVRMRGNLFLIDDNASILLDGNMTNYDNQYSNNVDGNDIYKLSTFGENIGMLRGTANLVIERRSLIAASDTTFFRLWNLQQKHYQVQIITENLQQNNLSAFLRDQYLGTDTPVGLNDTTGVDFYVTSQPGSYAQNRFTLIYKTIVVTALPVTFTGIQAAQQSNTTQVSWQVENETGIEKYVVEKSLDGTTFMGLNEISATHAGITNAYISVDKQQEKNTVFYRVKAVSRDGKLQYSSVAGINAGDISAGIIIYPNPVQNKLLQIQFNLPEAGQYKMSIVHANGTEQPLCLLKVDAGNFIKTEKLPANIAAGIYQLRIITATGKLTVKTILVL